MKIVKTYKEAIISYEYYKGKKSYVMYIQVSKDAFLAVGTIPEAILHNGLRTNYLYELENIKTANKLPDFNVIKLTSGIFYNKDYTIAYLGNIVTYKK